MVTEFAKEMIKNADSCGAQDIYIIPRQDNYELYMRIGQERRLIDVYRPDFMRNVGVNWALVTMIVVMVTWFLCVYQLLETIEAWKAWLFVFFIPNEES